MFLARTALTAAVACRAASVTAVAASVTFRSCSRKESSSGEGGTMGCCVVTTVRRPTGCCGVTTVRRPKGCCGVPSVRPTGCCGVTSASIMIVVFRLLLFCFLLTFFPCLVLRKGGSLGAQVKVLRLFQYTHVSPCFFRRLTKIFLPW